MKNMNSQAFKIQMIRESLYFTKLYI